MHADTIRLYLCLQQWPIIWQREKKSAEFFTFERVEKGKQGAFSDKQLFGGPYWFRGRGRDQWKETDWDKEWHLRVGKKSWHFLHHCHSGSHKAAASIKTFLICAGVLAAEIVFSAVWYSGWTPSRIPGDCRLVPVTYRHQHLHTPATHSQTAREQGWRGQIAAEEAVGWTTVKVGRCGGIHHW